MAREATAVDSRYDIRATVYDEAADWPTVRVDVGDTPGTNLIQTTLTPDVIDELAGGRDRIATSAAVYRLIGEALADLGYDIGEMRHDD